MRQLSIYELQLNFVKVLSDEYPDLSKILFKTRWMNINIYQIPEIAESGLTKPSRHGDSSLTLFLRHQ